MPTDTVSGLASAIRFAKARVSSRRLCARHDSINEAVFHSRSRIDRSSCEQHLERTLAADRARERNHRRRAEQTYAHARSRAALRGYTKVTRCYKLTTGGRCDSVDLGNDGLRDALNQGTRLGWSTRSFVCAIAADALVSIPPATAAVASISLRVSSPMGRLRSCIMVHGQKSLSYGWLVKSVTGDAYEHPHGNGLIPPKLLMIVRIEQRDAPSPIALRARGRDVPLPS